MASDLEALASWEADAWLEGGAEVDDRRPPSTELAPEPPNAEPEGLLAKDKLDEAVTPNAEGALALHVATEKLAAEEEGAGTPAGKAEASEADAFEDRLKPPDAASLDDAKEKGTDVELTPVSEAFASVVFKDEARERGVDLAAEYGGGAVSSFAPPKLNLAAEEAKRLLGCSGNELFLSSNERGVASTSGDVSSVDSLLGDGTLKALFSDGVEPKRLLL